MPGPANPMNLQSATPGLVNWDGTSAMSSTALTQYSVLSAASNNTLNNISPGLAGQILMSNGASVQPTFQPPVSAPPIIWGDAAFNQNAIKNHGYFVTNGITLTLPASGSLVTGDTIIVSVFNLSLVTIRANTGQVMYIGRGMSSSAGTATNNDIGSSVTFVYRSSDTSWHETSVTGTWQLY